MKQPKHTFLFVFILIFNTFLYAQQRGGNRSLSQQQGQREQMAMPTMNPENMARILIYDTDAVVKKLKIKKDPKKTFIINAITKHNNKINELKVFNYETFDEVKKYLNKKREEVKLSRDFTIMKEARMNANEMLAPIRSKVIKQQNMLNITLEKELSEKEYKKWLKYQQGELKKLNPKNTEKPQLQSGQRSGSGQMKGMGRSGY